MNNYELLIAKLDDFIRKFYANKLIKGILIFSAAAIAFYLLASVAEYFFYFPSWLRYLLLFIFIGIGGFALIYLIIIPLLKMQKLGNIISHEQAANIVGTHFVNIQDKLLNVLQLKQGLHNTISRELIEASIEQKTKELNPIHFKAAIDFASNKKYLPYTIIPILAFLYLLLAAPNVLKESAERLLAPSEKFIPKAPFTFKLINKNLEIPQFDDIEIIAQTEGKTIPDNVILKANGQEIMMQKKDKNTFSHTFFKVSKNITFSFSAAGFESQSFTLKTLKNPTINKFKIWINYPSYTGRKNEILDNIGDIVAPQGTTITWVFNTENADNLEFSLGNGNPVSMKKNTNEFSYTYRFLNDTTYNVILSNKQISRKDTMHYSVSVIPDMSPTINVQQYNDSLTDNYVLFVGDASDDYGIRNISLNYTIQKTNDKGQTLNITKSGSIPIQFGGGNSAHFNQFFDIDQLQLEPGNKLTYYFTACDNDAVNGSKCTKSAVFNYEKLSGKKLDSLIQKNQEQVTKDVNNAAKQNEKLDKEIKQMQDRLLQKNDLDWQDKKALEEMMQRNENMQKQIENIAKKFEQNNKQTKDKDYSDELKEKQENMEKLLDQLKNNELNERMKKMEELMNMLNKDKLMEQLKQVEQDNDLMEKDLNRVVEMMKQLERDMRMEDIAKKANELAQKQDELNKQMENGSLSNEELKKKQDELNKQMDELKKDIEEMEKVNESLENKMDLSEMKKEEQNADNNMQNSSNQLKSGNKSSASKSGKNAKESLEKLAQQMQDAAAGGSEDQIEQDLKSTRQLLQNLIRMSFAQEDLMNDVKNTSIADPKYVLNTQKQHKLKQDSKMIADSLFSLSKRQPKLSALVNKEIDGVNRNMENAILYLEERISQQANMHQQYVMMGANNLALMLNEILQQLLQQQAQQQEGMANSSCNKPGSKMGKKPGKKPGQGVGMQLGDIITQQQKLGDAMKQLMDKMGKKPGQDGKEGQQGEKGQKPGQQSGSGGSSGQGEGEQSQSEAEQMARIAAQQAALRKQLNDINKQLLKEGKSNPNLTKIQQDMDRNETDIVNKRLTNEILKRQSDILSRLLEAKEALRQQDQGEERESNSAKELNREIPQQLKDILKNKQSVIEYYKTVPAELKPLFKKMVEDYYQLIK